ncbi:MAG: hypothetical protein ACTSRA_01235 [Promethearchaeota archaeon]
MDENCIKSKTLKEGNEIASHLEKNYDRIKSYDDELKVFNNKSFKDERDKKDFINFLTDVSDDVYRGLKRKKTN